MKKNIFLPMLTLSLLSNLPTICMEKKSDLSILPTDVREKVVGKYRQLSDISPEEESEKMALLKEIKLFEGVRPRAKIAQALVQQAGLGCIELVEYLYELGASDQFTLTMALKAAVQGTHTKTPYYGHYGDVVAFLLDHGALGGNTQEMREVYVKVVNDALKMQKIAALEALLTEGLITMVKNAGYTKNDIDTLLDTVATHAKEQNLSHITSLAHSIKSKPLPLENLIISGARAGNIVAVQNYLNQGAKYGTVLKQALKEAIATGNQKVVALLLQNGAITRLPAWYTKEHIHKTTFGIALKLAMQKKQFALIDTILTEGIRYLIKSRTFNPATDAGQQILNLIKEYAHTAAQQTKNTQLIPTIDTIIANI